MNRLVPGKRYRNFLLRKLKSYYFLSNSIFFFNSVIKMEHTSPSYPFKRFLFSLSLVLIVVGGAVKIFESYFLLTKLTLTFSCCSRL